MPQNILRKFDRHREGSQRAPHDRASERRRHHGSRAATAGRRAGGRLGRRLCARSDTLGQRRDCRAVPRLPASRHAHQRRRDPLAAWRLGSAVAAAARQPAEPRLLAQDRGPTGAALPRRPARPARLRRQLAAGSRPQQYQLQLPRHGPGHGGGHGATRPPPLLRRRPRSRRAHGASDVPRPCRSREQGLPDGHRADLSRLDEHHEELGDRLLALVVHGAAGAVSGAADQLGPGRVLHQEPDGDPRRHRPRVPDAGGVGRVHPLLHVEDDHRLVPGLPRLADHRLRDRWRRPGSSRSRCPTLVLWGARGQPPERTREFAAVWRKYAGNVVDTDAMPCGHYIPEEMPDHVYERFIAFFKD